MDVQSKNPCAYTDNQLSCKMEASSFGKSLGVSPGIFRFGKIRKGIYDVTALKPDGKTVNEVQTMYSCSMNISEAQEWLEANSGPGEVGEKVEETLGQRDHVEGFNAKKVEVLQQKADSGDTRAQYGLGILHLMAAVKEVGVEHNPDRGLSLLNQAAEKKVPSAHFNLGIIRVFFPEDLKKRLKVSLKQDLVIGMMYLNLAAKQKHEPSQMVLNFLNQKQHPELSEPARDRVKQWKK